MQISVPCAEILTLHDDERKIIICVYVRRRTISMSPAIYAPTELPCATNSYFVCTLFRCDIKLRIDTRLNYRRAQNKYITGAIEAGGKANETLNGETIKCRKGKLNR